MYVLIVKNIKVFYRTIIVCIRRYQHIVCTKARPTQDSQAVNIAFCLTRM